MGADRGTKQDLAEEEGRKDHVERKRGEHERSCNIQNLAALNAFDNVDEDDNGSVPIDEEYGVADCLGLPILPNERDDALQSLDADGGGALERQDWLEMWIKRHKVNSGPAAGTHRGGASGNGSHTSACSKHSCDNGNDGDSNDRESGSDTNKIQKLAKRARNARIRAESDIHTAAWNGDLPLVKSFLGYDPNLANAVDGSEFGMGYRPLHYAAYGGFLEICLALYEAGARPLVTGDNGVTALFLAAQTGKSDVVGFLLDLGADPLVRERESGLCAVDVGDSYPDVLQQMQEKGAYSVPPAPDAAPSVTKIGTTSIQVAYFPLADVRGQLPPSRYKVKVEEVQQQQPQDDQRNEALSSPAELASSSEPVKLPEMSAITTTRGDSRARPAIVELILIPVGGETPSMSSASVTDEGEQKTVVTIRGLKPGRRYRVQVAAVNAIGFGLYGPPSHMVCTKQVASAAPAEKAAGKAEAHRMEGSGSASSMKLKGKGRQVLAMEKRRMMAAQAKRLQEEQQRAAEANHARRMRRLEEKNSNGRVGKRHGCMAGHERARGYTEGQGNRSQGVDKCESDELPLLYLHERRGSDKKEKNVFNLSLKGDNGVNGSYGRRKERDGGHEIDGSAASGGDLTQGKISMSNETRPHHVQDALSVDEVPQVYRTPTTATTCEAEESHSQASHTDKICEPRRPKTTPSVVRKIADVHHHEQHQHHEQPPESRRIASAPAQDSAARHSSGRRAGRRRTKRHKERSALQRASNDKGN